MAGQLLNAVELFFDDARGFLGASLVHQVAVSSANILVLVLWTSEMGKSLQYIMYNSGESTEPWGTPAFRWTVFERVLFTLILQDLLVRREDISLMNLRLLFRCQGRHLRCSRQGWHVL
jgi:hypothetical protein